MPPLLRLLMKVFTDHRVNANVFVMCNYGFSLKWHQRKIDYYFNISHLEDYKYLLYRENGCIGSYFYIASCYWKYKLLAFSLGFLFTPPV